MVNGSGLVNDKWFIVFATKNNKQNDCHTQLLIWYGETIEL